MGPRPLLLLGAFAAAAMVCWLALDLAYPVEKAWWEPAAVPWKRVRGQDRRLAVLRSGLQPGRDRDASLRPLLIGLIEQRLRSRGLRLDADPEAARAALGEALTDFVGHPPAKRAYDPAPLSDLLTRIESL
jgi:hypothetical protein